MLRAEIEKCTQILAGPNFNQFHDLFKVWIVAKAQGMALAPTISFGSRAFSFGSMAGWICSPGSQKGSEMIPKMDPKGCQNGTRKGARKSRKRFVLLCFLLQTDPTKGRGKVPQRGPKGTQNGSPNDTVPFWFEPKKCSRPQ